MLMKIYFILLLSIIVAITACEDLSGNAIDVVAPSGAEQEVSPDSDAECTSTADCPEGTVCVDSVCGVIEKAETVLCEQNSDCASLGEGQVCIDGICGSLEEMYLPQTCDAACKVTRVLVKTSGGESYDYVPGKGSYTAAGALEWRLVRGPNHCAGEAKIPVQVTLRQYGNIISERYITLEKETESKKLTHPGVSTLAFTLTAEEIDEECT